MAEPGPPPNASALEAKPEASGPPRSTDEIALELMKFIAVSTGYGRSSHSAAGFSGKPVTRSPEEHAEALLELFERCRQVVKKES
jgi:hypothetical protein